MVYHVDELGIHVGGQVLVHLLTVEHILAEILGWSLCWGFDLYGLLLKSLLYDLESEVV
jgi:hypothetical protein